MPGGSRPRAAAWGPAASNWRHLRSLGRFPLFVAQLKAWFVPLNPAGRHLEADGGGTREARQPGERLLCRSPCVEVGDEDPAAAPGGSWCDHGALLLSGRSPAGERIPPWSLCPFISQVFSPAVTGWVCSLRMPLPRAPRCCCPVLTPSAARVHEAPKAVKLSTFGVPKHQGPFLLPPTAAQRQGGK